MKRLYITGYRDYELGIFAENDPKQAVIKYALTEKITNYLENFGVEWVITGGNLGIEQWALEIANDLRADYQVQTSLILPFEGFAERWKEDKQLRLNQLKGKVDFFATTSSKPYDNFMQLKNHQQFLLEHTDLAVMVYDPEFPGRSKYDYDAVLHYQEQNDYILDLVTMDDLQEYVTNYQESLMNDDFS